MRATHYTTASHITSRRTRVEVVHQLRPAWAIVARFGHLPHV